jgi:hypothetical protein
LGGAYGLVIARNAAAETEALPLSTNASSGAPNVPGQEIAPPASYTLTSHLRAGCANRSAAKQLMNQRHVFILSLGAKKCAPEPHMSLKSQLGIYRRKFYAEIDFV